MRTVSPKRAQGNESSDPSILTPIEFESGFTWRSFLAVLYSIVVFSPALIWMSLVTLGVTLGGAIEFCTILMFVEFARLAGRPITRQEVAIIFGMATLAGSGGFLSLIYRAYFVQSPLLGVLGLNPNEIPTWWVPPIRSGIWDLRTFLHPDWLVPLMVFSLVWFLYPFTAIFFGLLGRELFIEGERLPFPIQQINVEAVVTLAERHENRLYAFTCAAVPAFIYGTLLYTVPTVSMAAGYPLQLIPIPWTDYWYYVQDYFPGASFGIATDASLIAMGIMLPTSIVVSMFIGSFARFFIIDWLLVQFSLTAWATRWTHGMTIMKIFQESTLYFWACPVIGMTFAVGILPLCLRAKTLGSTFKSIFAFKPSKVDEANRISGSRFSGRLMIAFFLIGCIGTTVVFAVLTPGFPVWALIFYNIGLPFVGLLAFGRIVGETGQEPTLPYLQQLTILATNYNKLDAWFLPLQFRPGSAWMAQFKICQLTETSIGSWIKMYLIIYPLSILVGFLYTQLFWQLAPIPSAMYPAPAVTWPVQIIYDALWITRPAQFFKPDLILYSFLGTSGLIALFNFIRVPFSMVSAVVGIGLPSPITFTMFIGLIIGKLIAWKMGTKWFAEFKGTMAAGIMTGQGVAAVVGVALALIAKSIWARPF